MNDYKKLISALRCSASVCDGKCDENCPYRTLKEITPDFPLNADFTISGIGYFESCDYDRMVLDAADAIERLANDRNASVDALKALVANIDAVPTRRGRWLLKIHDDECGGGYLLYHCSVCDKARPHKRDNYCPNCGTKMDEEVEHD